MIDANGDAARNQTEALNAIRDMVGQSGWIEPDGLQSALTDSLGNYHGACRGMACPSSTDQVSRLMAATYRAGIPVVPQGGNTGRVGAATPDASGDAILLSLHRMAAIREIDATDYSMIVEAGCILQKVQDAAAEQNRLFPLSLGAEGSCQIGGNVATNAGGISVLKFGNMRELVLGLEIVLPDGRIWNGLNRLRKNNTGYDLKQLFIGSEGTLGVVTAACLRLFPAPREKATALCAISELAAAPRVLSMARECSSDALTSCEIMPRNAIGWAEKHVDGVKLPIAGDYDWFILLEFSGTTQDGATELNMERVLEAAFDEGLVVDAVIASSEGQRQKMWLLREAIIDGAVREGPCISCDISVPLRCIPDFIEKATADVRAAHAGSRPYPFGHLGDGNIHFNICAPEGETAEVFRRFESGIRRVVYDTATSFGGTFSAEHGVGMSKLKEMVRYKPEIEIELMRTLKRAIDPKGLMNPGKVLTAD